MVIKYCVIFQVISLTVRSRLTDEAPNSEELPYCRILNGLLPNDIRVLAWASVADNFSARFSCKMRTYKYWFPRGDLKIEVRGTLNDLAVPKKMVT